MDHMTLFMCHMMNSLCSYRLNEDKLNRHAFRVSLPSSSSSKQYMLEEDGENRLLVVSRGFPFAVHFNFNGLPPAHCEVWALIRCKEEDYQLLGPVGKCARHSQDGGVSFYPCSSE